MSPDGLIAMGVAPMLFPWLGSRLRQRLALALGLGLLLMSSGVAEAAARFDHLSVEDGLSHSTVWAITQDERGFLWIGTANGLNRYDGHRVEIYEHDPADPRSLAANTVYAIHEDRSGRLWIGTSAGLERFHRQDETFRHHRHDPNDPTSLGYDVIWRLFEDRSGSLWIGTWNGLGKMLDSEAGTFRHYPYDPQQPNGLSGRAVLAIHEDADGDLWIGSDGGLDRLDRRSDTFARYRHDPHDAASLSHDRVVGIAAAPRGQLWVATLVGIDVMDPATGQVARHYPHDPQDPGSLSSDEVLGLHVDSHGELWVATHHGGLNRLLPESGTFQHYRHDVADPHSLSDNTVFAIHEDRSGLLWLGTFAGVDTYNRARESFMVYRQQAQAEVGLSGNNIRVLYEDADGMLWVGSDDGGLDGLDSQHRVAIRHRHDPTDPESLVDTAIRGVLRDRQGVLWVATLGGLSRFDSERQGFVHYLADAADADRLSNNMLSCLYEDSAGRLWIGSFSHLHRYDRASDGFKRYGLPDDLERPAPDIVVAIAEDSAGNLWFGSYHSGLFGYHSEGDAFTRLAHDPGDPQSLSGDKIAAIYEDRGGGLWIGTFGAGLNHRAKEGAGFRHLSQADGLASNSVVSILEDDQGYLWLGTTNGLNRYDPIRHTFVHFASDDGLAGLVLNSSAALRRRDGELYFGGSAGLTAFFPDRITVDRQPPTVTITDFQVLNEPVQLRRVDPASPLESSILETDALTLTHQHKVLTFELAALHFASPRRNRYAYRLDGFDDDWVATSADRRLATYTNLDPGHYVFRAKAANPHGVWSKEASLDLTVLPPPWRSWWAWLVYAAGLAAVVSGFVWSQRQKVERERAISERLREVDRLKDEFLAKTSHELRTPLYGMVGLAESLRDNAVDRLPPTASAQLAMIVASGRRLASLINNILDFSRLKHKSLDIEPRPVELHALVEVVLALTRPLLSDKQLTVANTIDRDLPAVAADEDRLQQILHCLVANAIEFTDSGRVEIAAAVEAGGIRVSVIDTGIGIAEDLQERIFAPFEQGDGAIDRAHAGTGLGLAVARQLVELHGGELSVTSKLGEGSTFFFTLPLVAVDSPASTSARRAASVARQLTNLAPRIASPAPAASSAAPLGDSAAAEDAARILLVDDEPINRLVLFGHLTAAGYRLTQASSGAEALRHLEEDNYDLVLLDVMMPRMSGYEVCRTIRRTRSLDQLPVIFLSARNQLSDLLAGLAAGGNDYLTKPISKGELLARVETHLELLSVHRRLLQMVDERSVQVSERDALLAERDEILRELRLRNAELARFNYTVSHDLMNPLVTIKNFVGASRHDLAQGQIARLEGDLASIESAADRLQRLLKELLELSRLGHVVQPCHEISASELVEEAVAALAGELSARGVELTVAADLPVLSGDRASLLEVIKKLLANAVKYMGAQRSPRIEIGVRQQGGEDIFFVRDNGSGIEPRYHDRIFGLFERLETDTEGTGVGLAVVKRILEMHGGRIWVESEGKGRGSIFCFTVPPSPFDEEVK